jgi:periplasmic copper chaperone A
MKILQSAGISALLILLIVGMARAEENSIRIDDAWARATPGGAKTGAVYLTISNTGTMPEQLLSVATPAADHAEPHSMKMENGIMEMRPLGTVTIAPGQRFDFAPDGNHIMLVGLKAPLKEGESLPLTLNFDHAGSIKVTVAIAKIGAMHGPMESATGATPGMPGMSR